MWLWEKNLNAGINGHVDVLQVRNGLIYVLDFKPGAIKEKVEKVGSQLFFYASGVSFWTGIRLDKFRCAWFDEKVYFEFEPARANVKFPGSKHRSQILKGKVLNFVSRVSPRSWKGSGRVLREDRS